MDFFTVALFGHREIEDLRSVDRLLLPVLKELVYNKRYITFLIGRNGEFDEYAASLIKKLQRESGKENSDLTLVLAYTVAKMEDYEKYYDSIIIPEALYGKHPKSAITLKNQWMVEQSDLVIVYLERKKGGAYRAMKYADKNNKKVIELSP